MAATVRAERSTFPKTTAVMALSVATRRPNGSRSKSLCSATPLATKGWAICIRTARPPPSNSTPPPFTRRITASGGKNGSGSGNPSVEGRALFERASEWFDDGAEAGLVHHLAVLGTRGARDVLVDQR